MIGSRRVSLRLLEKNISNPELGVDLLSQELGLSRANLYRKLKAVTELSPTELIRNNVWR